MTATVAAVSSGNGTSSYAVTVPAGTTNGDLLIAVAASDWGTFAGNDVPAAFKTGTGGTTLGTSDFDAGSNGLHVALGARIASGEPASYSFSVGSSADHVAAIIRITGHDSTPVIAQVASTTGGGNGATAPSITPNGTDDLLLTFHLGDSGGGSARTWTPPPGMTEHVDRQSGVWTSLLVASLQNPSSPSGTKTAVPTGTTNLGAACTISIKSAGGGSTVTGTIAGSLPALTGSVTGALEVSGTVAGTLPALTGAVSAQVEASGSLTATLPALTGSLSASLEVGATLAGTLPALTGALTGNIPISGVQGNLTGELPALTGSATGTVEVTATLAVALPALTGALSAEAVTTATFTATLPSLTGQATAELVVGVTLTGALPAVTGAFTATVTQPGEYDPLLDSVITVRLNQAAAVVHRNLSAVASPANSGDGMAQPNQAEATPRDNV